MWNFVFSSWGSSWATVTFSMESALVPIEKESESLEFIGLEIPRDYRRSRRKNV